MPYKEKIIVRFCPLLYGMMGKLVPFNVQNIKLLTYDYKILDTNKTSQKLFASSNAFGYVIAKFQTKSRSQIKSLHNC